MAAYMELLRERHVKHLLTGNILGRLPTGMGPLVIALFLRTLQMDYALVGVLTALYGISTAVGGPALGRLVDLYGQPRVLLLSMVVSTLGFFLLSVASGEDLVLAALGITVAGLFTPPLEPCLRSLWTTVLRTQASVNTAYALDAAVQQIIFVVGPLLVVVVVNQLSAPFAVFLTGTVMLFGTVAFVAARPVRTWRPYPRTADWAGPLRARTLRVLLLSFFCVGGTLGILNLAVIAYSEDQNVRALSGGLVGANALGALIGGLIYSNRYSKIHLNKQLALLLLGLSACYAPLALVPGPVLMLPLVILSGLFLAPGLACAFSIIGEKVPNGTATEAFSWLTTVFMLGNAVGSSMAGNVLQHWGIHAVFLGPTLLGLLAALILVVFMQLRSKNDLEIVHSAG